jgi:hypothetical protein
MWDNLGLVLTIYIALWAVAAIAAWEFLKWVM